MDTAGAYGGPQIHCRKCARCRNRAFEPIQAFGALDYDQKWHSLLVHPTSYPSIIFLNPFLVSYIEEPANSRRQRIKIPIIFFYLVTLTFDL